MRVIPDSGPRDARIAIVAEMDAAAEEAQGRHLVGPPGFMLNRWLRAVGIDRDRDCFVTNVVPYRHNPKNAIALVPRDELADWIRQLHAKFGEITPSLIVPMGNTALSALTGLSSITKYRGSILEYANAGRRTKVIPTQHPASVFRQPMHERRCIIDWRRIATDSAFRDLRLPEREHFIEPTLADLRDYVADAQARAEVLAIDIETPRKIALVETTNKRGKRLVKRVKGDPRVTVVGFAFDPSFSFTVPTTLEYWAPQGVDVDGEVWPLLRQLCALPNVEKGGQNFLFDRWWLARNHGCPVTQAVYDTRWMSHCLDVLDEHSLGYQASIHLRTQYWKDDSKDDDKDSDTFVASGIEAMRTYWRYNGKDNTHTRELMDVHHARLAAGGRLAHYFQRYAALYDAMLDMALRGIRTDQRNARRQQAKFLAERIGLQDTLNDAAGAPLFGPKGSLVPKRLNTYLYDTLRLPVQKDRKTGNAASNEIIVRRLMLKHPAKLGAVGPLILRNRRLEALSRFVKEGIVDDDGYTRCQYGFTYTMRFTSGKAANRRGANLQNTDRELLSMYVPDPGHVFVEVDECVDGSSRVLMADMSWRYAKDIRTGDKVVGFDEDFKSGLGVPGSGSKYRHAVVTGNQPLIKPRVRVYTDKGEVICSTTHLWVGRAYQSSNNRKWIEAQDLRVGDRISFFGTPWEGPEDSYDAGWLAGFFDGEGWISHNTSVSVGQNPGLLLDHALMLLDARGFPYVTRRQRSGTTTVPGHANGDRVAKESRVVHVRIRGGYDSFRFMGQIRPRRLSQQRDSMWVGRRTWGHTTTPAVVKYVEFLGDGVVYPVSTTTKTLVVEGFLSHNSQGEDRIVKTLAASLLTTSPERRAELLRRARAMPWENDEHRLAASLCFKKPQSVITKDERYIGKRARHACVDYETEVLTYGGWAKIPELGKNTAVAQWDSLTGAITFEPPTAIHQYAYTGEMISFAAQAFDQVITPEHRMPYMTNGTHKTAAASELFDLPSVRLPISGMYAFGSRDIAASLVKLVAAVQADGHLRNTSQSYRIEFHLKKQRKIERLVSILDALDVKRSHYVTGSGSTKITFRYDAVLDWLEMPGKRFSHAIWNWRPELIDVFVDELRYWDGHFEESHHHRREEYFTANRENADFVQTLLHLRGREALVREETRTLCVSFNRRRYVRRPKPVTWDHDGFVYCLSTATGFFLVRRQGCISITGNSNYGMRGKTLSEQLLKEGYSYSPEECDGFIDTVIDRDTPEVRDWQRHTRQVVFRDRRLANSWGHVVDFTYERLGDDLYREAYATVPQSELTSIIKYWGLIPLHRALRVEGWDARVCLEKHDSLLISTHPKHAWDILAFLRASLERPRMYGGHELLVPIECKIGINGAMATEFKKPPSRLEFEAAIEALL